MTEEKRNEVELDHFDRLHFIGAGGCSMSGIAEILSAQGHTVTGSDRDRSQFTAKLESLGIPVAIGQKGEQVGTAQAVIYSAAIKPENPERVWAREHGIPEIERCDALGQLSRRFGEVAAIAGCHGKTTISSMLAYIDQEAKLGATLHVGGYVGLLDGGVKVGNGDLFITEACEYVRSFLSLSPTLVLINNIDNDHLDCYRDLDEIIETFGKLCSLVPENGKIIVCRDDKNVQKLLPSLGRSYQTYGLAEGDVHAADIVFDEEGCASFTLTDGGTPLGRITLHVPGTHNIINSLAAYSVAKYYGVPFESSARALSRFENTKRRFEFMGERNGRKIYHDYGHHPNEIACTLEAASRMPHRALYCVFQCNSYTRARTLFCGDSDCFKRADKVLVPDIYPGRETDTGIVHARDMVSAINAVSHNALYLGDFDSIAAWLDENGQPGDLVVTVGSGNVYKQTEKLL